MNPLSEYVAEAIRRISEGDADGSHALGVYNKSANLFEKAFAVFAATATKTADAKKSTLGQLIHELQKMPALHPPRIAQIISGGRVVNDVWKKVKHGDDPSIKQLLTGLRAMLCVLPLLKKEETSNFPLG